MLGETLRPSVGKWNNTFNHMKQSAQDYFCTYFLFLSPSLPFLFHWITVSHFVFLSLSLFAILFSLSLALPRTHTYIYLPLQMSTTINREFLLNPLYTQAHRHTQSMIYYKIRLITHAELRHCAFQQKHTIIRQYNIIITALTVNYVNHCWLKTFFSHVFVWIGVCLISTHLFLHKRTREEHSCVRPQSSQNQGQSHTLSSSSLSACHSAKTDVHTDTGHPFIHQQEKTLSFHYHPACI